MIENIKLKILFEIQKIFWKCYMVIVFNNILKNNFNKFYYGFSIIFKIS